MTRIIVKKLIWDNWNRLHITKHSVSIEEVEDSVQHLLAHKKAKKGRYLLICRAGTRLLSIFVSRVGTGEYYVATARDSDKKERQIVYEKEKKPNS